MALLSGAIAVLASFMSTDAVQLSADMARPSFPFFAKSKQPKWTVGAGSDIKVVSEAIKQLTEANPAGLFTYATPMGEIRESDVYKWADMVTAVGMMALDGVGKTKLWLGDTEDDVTYGLVSVAAFLSQAMQETIHLNACDEINWADLGVQSTAGGSLYTSTAACGQLGQSYQDYRCSAGEEHMECDADPNMQMRAFTDASWDGAPPKLFCAPRSKVPQAPLWSSNLSQCAPHGTNSFATNVAGVGEVVLDNYLEYVNNAGQCKEGKNVGGWTFQDNGCEDGVCPGVPAPNFGRPQGRTDVEGCCWWGRGVIQTTGVCNYGKLNWYMGKTAKARGAKALFPEIDFCKNPASICDPASPKEVKWAVGLFYWLNSVQSYQHKEWNFVDALKNFVDNGFSDDNAFINGVSGIVNRGCHNPPNCGTGELSEGEERLRNFQKVLQAMDLIM